MTEYIILKRLDPETLNWEEQDDIVEASSSRRALDKAGIHTTGDYVAVPLRSWRPLTVKVETVSKVTVG